MRHFCFSQGPPGEPGEKGKRGTKGETGSPVSTPDLDLILMTLELLALPPPS